MKIKKQVEMNEKELIKYLVDHDNTTIRFSGISYDGAWLSIEPEIESKVHFEFKDASTNEKTFTVEVEEEITEDTLLSKLILIYEGGFIQILENQSINILNKKLVENIYILNDDLTMTLIWCDGKLVV